MVSINSCNFRDTYISESSTDFTSYLLVENKPCRYLPGSPNEPEIYRRVERLFIYPSLIALVHILKYFQHNIQSPCVRNLILIKLYFFVFRVKTRRDSSTKRMPSLSIWFTEVRKIHCLLMRQPLSMY